MSTVGVTGGSGFLGSYCVQRLLADGHRVRTTVRSLQREGEMRALLDAAVDSERGSRLAFFSADLEKEAGWAEAMAGCEFVLHIASPFPATIPKHDDELVRPARDGALRALRASRDAGVKRVVLTSSFAAIGYGHPPSNRPFDETDWTDPDSRGLSAYARSKTVAERAAWDFIAREGQGLELAVVNPVGIFGPLLGAHYPASIGLVKRMLDGALPGLPKLYFGVVDVRDVVDLHVSAMTHPEAKGERFLAAAGDFMSALDIARLLKRRLDAAARNVPTFQFPNWLVRLASIRSASARQSLPELGKIKNATHEKATRMLGWVPRSNEEAIVASGESLMRLGLLKGQSKAA